MEVIFFFFNNSLKLFFRMVWRYYSNNIVSDCVNMLILLVFLVHSVENQAYLRKTTPPLEVFLYAFSWGVTKVKVALNIYFYNMTVPPKNPTPGRSSLPPSNFGPIRAQHLVMWPLLLASYWTGFFPLQHKLKQKLVAWRFAHCTHGGPRHQPSCQEYWVGGM